MNYHNRSVLIVSSTNIYKTLINNIIYLWVNLHWKGILQYLLMKHYTFISFWDIHTLFVQSSKYFLINFRYFKSIANTELFEFLQLFIFKVFVFFNLWIIYQSLRKWVAILNEFFRWIEFFHLFSYSTISRINIAKYFFKFLWFVDKCILWIPSFWDFSFISLLILVLCGAFVWSKIWIIHFFIIL